MTTDPSWLPTDAEYTARGWTRYAETFASLIPDTWHRYLWKAGSEADLDHTALGEIMGHARDLLRWILEGYHPQRDTEGQFLDRWETDYGLVQRATIAARAAWIQAFARIRGTTKVAMVKAAFSELWDGNPEDVAITWNDPTDVHSEQTIGADTYANEQNSMFIHHAAETDWPDVPLGLDLIRLLLPAGEHWYFGQKRFPPVDDDECVADMFCAYTP